jgi:hypothetical protein
VGRVAGREVIRVKEMTKGEQIFFRLGTLNVNSLKVVRKRRNILRQLRSHCDATCFQESKLDGASANDVCKDDSGSWAFNNKFYHGIFSAWFFLVLCATVAALPVVQPHWARVAKEEERAAAGGRDKAAFLKRCDIIFN